MSEDRTPYGNESAQWERDAQQLRQLVEESGYTLAAAASELDIHERDMRSLCAGREPVPRVLLHAMRWVVQNKPNAMRWLQVHWKKVGRQVKSSDKFEIRAIDEEMRFLVNGEIVIRGHIEDLLNKGLVSVHTSHSNDRFLWNSGGTVEVRPSAVTVKLDETFGRLGFRLNRQLRADGACIVGPPSVEFFTVEKRVHLSPVLMTSGEIDNAVGNLVRNAQELGLSAKRALKDAQGQGSIG